VIFVVNRIHSGVVFTGEANPAGLVGGKLTKSGHRQIIEKAVAWTAAGT
jgi:hypothetical protein